MPGDEFDHLLRRLDSDRESAGERYKILHQRLTEFFGRRGCIFPDELADQTLDRVARRLAGGEVIHAEDPKAYCLGVARKVWYEYLQAPARRNEPLESLSPRENPAVETSAEEEEERLEKERQDECLTECLNGLPAEKRAVIENYYREKWQTQIQNRRQMADRLGLKQTGLRARAHRIRRELEECVRNCFERARK